jgi:beta-barrel assembly-enhancing protease
MQVQMLQTIRRNGGAHMGQPEAPGFPKARIKISLLIPALLFLFSCATTSLPPIQTDHQEVRLEKDERELWEKSKQLDTLFDNKDFLYRDPELEAFLNDLAGRLLPADLQGPQVTLSVRIIKDPSLNAFALPHGSLYFHTGLLARMENEDQLATVMGHELTHFTHRHAIREIRAIQNKEAYLGILNGLMILAGASVGVPELGAELGKQMGLVGAIWTLASVRGYSREREAEADEEGFRAMVKAGFDPMESVRAFEHLQYEIVEERIEEPFFFATHPRIEERVSILRNLVNKQRTPETPEASRMKKSEAYLNRMERLVVDNAILDARRGRSQTAQSAVELLLRRRLNRADLQFASGEIYRLSGKGETETLKAVAAYEKTVRLDPNHAKAYRELGFLYRTRNRRKEALEAFGRYIEISPAAADGAIIRWHMEELKKTE